MKINTNQERISRIKTGLNSDIYSKVDELDGLEDDTFSSTSKLADILDGYLTKVDNIKIEDEIDDLRIIDEDEIELEIDDTEILMDYNQRIHDFNEDTSEGINTDEISELLSQIQDDSEPEIINMSTDDETISPINTIDIVEEVIYEPKSIDDIHIGSTTRDLSEENATDLFQVSDIVELEPSNQEKEHIDPAVAAVLLATTTHVFGTTIEPETIVEQPIDISYAPSVKTSEETDELQITTFEETDELQITTFEELENVDSNYVTVTLGDDSQEELNGELTQSLVADEAIENFNINTQDSLSITSNLEDETPKILELDENNDNESEETIENEEDKEVKKKTSIIDILLLLVLIIAALFLVYILYVGNFLDPIIDKVKG